MFKLSYNRYNTRSQMALDVPLCKTSKWQQTFSFLRPKIWTNISHSTKNVKTTASFAHALNRKVLS